VNKTICKAISRRLLLEFEYRGLRRVVAPYCHGTTAQGREVLRAIQVEGESASGGFGFGKLWLIDEISHLSVTDQPFSPNDPNYNPNDKAIHSIHCRV
jgi:hypothetical protein